MYSINWRRVMKKPIFLIVVLMSFSIFLAAQGDNKAKGTNEKEAKIADIRKLMEITGSGNIGMQVLNSMIDSYRKMLPQVPQSFWDEFLKDVNPQSLVELIIPIYDKYLTHDEIKDIIKFYESPSGRKLIQVLPQITNESMEAGRIWGKEMGERIIERLQREVEESKGK
jgi:hypothetical protein